MNQQGDQFIAIVGMACRFAGCRDLKSFWLRVLNGVPAFSDYPDASAHRFLLENQASFSHVSSLKAGYLGDLWQVRSSSVTIPQAALAGTNPEFPLAAELALLALRDAGVLGSAIPHDRIGVIAGYSPGLDPATVGWCQHGLMVDQAMDLVRRCFPHGKPEEFDALRANLVAALPEYDSRNISWLLHHSLASVIAGKCDINGPAYCVNAGEISSQAAIQAACDALRDGRLDAVLAGAVNGLVTPQVLMPYSKMGLVSKLGAVHPFGRAADGTLFGEGGGFLVLKRYDDAVRDDDRVYALVRACGMASDGNARHVEGAIASAVKRAWHNAPSEINTIDLLEANGAGVPGVDRAEIKAMNALMNSPSPLPSESIALGSVKALVGHCGAASGIASTIKAALALYHRVIPPAQEAGQAAEVLHLQETPFYLNPRPRPWIHNDAGPARRAGITSLSVGGGAAHLVLEQVSYKP